MEKIIIPIDEYAELLEKSVRLDILKRFLAHDGYHDTEIIEMILGAKERGGE